ncbi:MAG: TusE/DsrC/DsvC family sulfur relay protein [Thermodesulfovibrionales bacterium]|nr:TusE/DsrC/DsvC family sulfur relay protein [Thermodesulfovibrionales bacterium]
MPIIEYGDLKINVDEEGYLVNFDDWNEKVACALAEKEGIEELTKEKLDILKFVRQFYKEFNFFPILNAVCKNIHQPHNCVTEQFVSPMVAWKLAGLPKPDDFIITVLEHKQTPD